MTSEISFIVDDSELCKAISLLVRLNASAAVIVGAVFYNSVAQKQLLIFIFFYSRLMLLFISDGLIGILRVSKRLFIIVRACLQTLTLGV